MRVILQNEERTRGLRACYWIEEFCFQPDGPCRGRPVPLTPDERALVLQIYDGPDAPRTDVPVAGALASYLVLLNVCGPEAVGHKDYQGPVPSGAVDVWTLWASAAGQLRAVLERNGRQVVCRELGVAYEAA
jgi:hypothetical protein